MRVKHLIPAAILAWSAFAQETPPSCTRTLTQGVAPGSAILVYQNGLLLEPGVDYTVSGRMITHLWWEDGDRYQYVYDRIVKYTYSNDRFPLGESVNMYASFREFGTCTGKKDRPPNATRVRSNQTLVRIVRIESSSPSRLFMSRGPAPADTKDELGIPWESVMFLDMDGKLKVRLLSGQVFVLTPQ